MVNQLDKSCNGFLVTEVNLGRKIYFSNEHFMQIYALEIFIISLHVNLSKYYLLNPIHRMLV